MNKMKLYQFELLLSLFLIIVNTTLGKQTEEIQGLSQIKHHLFAFGYFQGTPLDFDDVLDEETISSIKAYQRFFNLKVTGHLNTETLQQISLPRCGIPDLKNEHRFTDRKGNNWFPKGTKKLTYGFLPESKISIDKIKVFRNAFTRWSETTRVLNFSETSSYDDADIKIGFNYINYNDEFDGVVVGESLLRNKLYSNVTSGMIRVDDTKVWDLETVVMHQIGHLLGLFHSSDVKSIMYPTIVPLHPKKVQITDSDNQAIQQLYTNPNSDHSGCFKFFESSPGLLTSLSLGLAFVALMNLAS